MKPRILCVVSLLIAAVTLSVAGDDVVVAKSKSKKQGYLGVGIQDVTPRLAREVELKVKEGAYVNDVVDDSPADSAGLKEGDVITEYNGKKIELAEDLTKEVRDTKPGTKVNLTVNRKGEKKSLAVNVGKNRMRMPMAHVAPHAPARVIVNQFGNIEGMELMELNKQLGAYFDAPNGRGILVKEVEEESNAEKAGIKAGDVITKIGDETINDIGDLHDAMEDLDEGDKVSVDLLRKGKKSSVSLEISERNYGNIWHFNGDNFNRNFEFRMQPHLENMQREIEMKMRELPRIERELQQVKMRRGHTEV
ncbi:MAG: PDZ domain-containing protein [Ignavibacteriales bacterium]|nr:PDZ domain-containing protein [Ignavibacteriales bacterium]